MTRMKDQVFRREYMSTRSGLRLCTRPGAYVGSQATFAVALCNHQMRGALLHLVTASHTVITGDPTNFGGGCARAFAKCTGQCMFSRHRDVCARAQAVGEAWIGQPTCLAKFLHVPRDHCRNCWFWLVTDQVPQPMHTEKYGIPSTTQTRYSL